MSKLCEQIPQLSISCEHRRWLEGMGIAHCRREGGCKWRLVDADRETSTRQALARLLPFLKEDEEGCITPEYRAAIEAAKRACEG